MQGTMPGARRRGSTHMAWMDNIKTWTGLSMEESVRMTEINGESTSTVWPTLGSRTAKEQKRTARGPAHGVRVFSPTCPPVVSVPACPL